jgi:DeoR/GlpR family transcriptional regulator of sugar metabolism
MGEAQHDVQGNIEHIDKRGRAGEEVSRAAMDGATRCEEMLRWLGPRTRASIAELAVRFQVSEMTARRDLEKLAANGRVIRIPGGAMMARGAALEKSFRERSERMAESKDRIGRAAAALVKDGEAVVLDSGSTTLYIARHLRRRRDIVVVTFSLAALEELRDAASVRVELTGGAYRRSSHDLTGAAVAESLARVHVNKVFFGAQAVSFTKGVMGFDPESQPALLEAGGEKILVVDSGKIGREALYAFCPIRSCDLIITDSGAQPADLARLRKLTRVLVAE